MPPHTSRTIVAMLCMVGGFAAPLPAEIPASLRDTWRSSADLAAVSFCDVHHGWAVGTHGAIWATNDGGQNWQRQSSPVVSPLTGVSFADPLHGWAVGTEFLPYTPLAQGVLLVTNDGGLTWQRDRDRLLPPLAAVRRFDRQSGLIAGGASGVFPAGLLATSSEAHTWAAPPQGVGPGWAAAAWPLVGHGTLVGLDGQVALLRNQLLEAVELPERGLRRPLAVAFGTPLQGWIAGQGGLLWHSLDAGRSWTPCSIERPASRASEPALPPLPDAWQAVAALQDTCWLAGSTGTHVWRTIDAGNTWKAHPTGQSAPLTALTFVDPEHGWAVGGSGVILATTDGGQSWSVQRPADAKAAVWGLFLDERDVPWEVFAKWCAEEGFRGRVTLVGQCTHTSTDYWQLSRNQRVNQALAEVGVDGMPGTWRFPLPEHGVNLAPATLATAWSRANGRPAEEALAEFLTLQIRQCQPEIVVTSADEPGSAGQKLLRSALRVAIRAANDPSQFVEQLGSGDLRPWQVKKLYEARRDERGGEANIYSTQWAPHLGQSLGERTVWARGFTERAPRPTPEHWSLIYSGQGLTSLPPGRAAFTGVFLAPGQPGRRKLSDPTGLFEAGVGNVQALARRQRHVAAILTSAVDEPGAPARMLGELGPLSEQLPPDAGAALCFRIASRQHAQGQWREAAETWELLAQRFPQSAVTPAALVWLWQYATSAEAQYREQRARGAGQAPASLRAARSAAQVEPADADPTALDSLDSLALRQPPKAADLAVESAPRLAAFAQARLAELAPAAPSEPPLAWLHAGRQSLRGDSVVTDRVWRDLLRAHPHDPWGWAAAGELWLQKPTDTPPVPVATWSVASARPHLDGQLGDACWASAERLELRASERGDTTWPATVWLCADARFLYLAADCLRPEAVEVSPIPRVRQRDAMLNDEDRLIVHLDTDRDRSVAYTFSVDHRGATRESCWQDDHWNPQWYVAARGEPARWSIEVAIPWTELSGQSWPHNGAWLVGFNRVAPGYGLQAWTLPATVDGELAGLGILRGPR